MSVIETIETIRNLNIIEDTTVDYNQYDRNVKLAESIGRVDLTDLKSEDALKLGFGIWDEKTNLHLIPFYLYDFLEYGQTLTSINGEQKVVKPGYNGGLPSEPDSNPDYIDNDHRFGCLAYGYHPKG